MIVNTGKIDLLDAKLARMATYLWVLFTTNVTILATTVWGDLTEAAWGGYARVTAGTWSAPAVVASKAVSLPTAPPSFGNSSGAPQTFWGWALVRLPGGAGSEVLIAAANIGATVLASGGNYPLAASMTEDQQ